MADDLPSGKEFFEAARKELGYEKNLLCDEGRVFDGREADGEFCMVANFDVGLDYLSQEIALECGQAKEIAPGVIKYRSREPERFLTPEEREREREEFGPTPDHRKELAQEFRAAIDALPPMPDKACDWCGTDLYRDHKTVDRDFLMCNPCHTQYFGDRNHRQQPGMERCPLLFL